MLPVCHLKVANVLLLVLQEAEAKTELDMQEIHWKMSARETEEELEKVRRAVWPQCRADSVQVRGKERQAAGLAESQTAAQC